MFFKKLLIIISLAMLLFMAAYKNNNKISVAVNEEGHPYAIAYESGNANLNINVFKGEDGNEYLFLPSGMDIIKVTSSMSAKSHVKVLDGDALPDAGENCIYAIEGKGISSVFIDCSATYEEYGEDKDIKREADLTIFDKDLNLLTKRRIEIKGHGQSSWNYEQKSIRLIFDEPTSILGLSEGREYIAVSDNDPSQMRNKICENMAKVLEMEYVSSSEYVNLYYNNEYLGLYKLYEKIMPGEQRVNIKTSPELGKGEKRSLEYIENEDIKGYIYPDGLNEVKDQGIILKEEPLQRFGNVKRGFVNDEKYQFSMVYPKYPSIDHLTEVREYLYKIFEATENPEGTIVINGEEKHYTRMIDVYSFAARYLVEQVSKNKDGTRCSSFYYIKNYEGMDSILFAGPVWDYNIAFGDHYRNRMYTYPYGLIPLKPESLYAREDFMSYVIELYKEKLRGYMLEGVFSDIEDFSIILENSAKMDSLRWGKDINSFKAAGEQLKSFIEARNWALEKEWVERVPSYRINFVKNDTIVHSIQSYEGESIESVLTWQPFPEELKAEEWFEEDMETIADLSAVPKDDLAFYAK